MEERLDQVRPITPDEVIGLKREQIPGIVLTIFNGLITRNFHDGQSIVRQDDVVSQLREAGIDINQAFREHWLDVEGVYGEIGWKVEYEKPGYNEPGEAFFTFKVKRRSKKEID